METLIRRCPSCNCDRPLQEMFCMNDGCGYQLTDIEPSQTGENISEDCQGTEDSSSISSKCPNGHDIAAGDLLCFECDSSVDSGPSPVEDSHDGIVVDGWKLGDSLSTFVKGTEKFSAYQADALDERRFVIVFFSDDSVPDFQLLPLQAKLGDADISSLRAYGSFVGQSYQVWEELAGNDLESLLLDNDVSRLDLRALTESLGRTLNLLGEQAIRHRNIRPANIRVSDGLSPQFQITGFECAVLSPYDLMESFGVFEPNKYSAPEAIVGGLSSASDWWSLGIVLLELATHGSFFHNVDERAFLINVVTRGVEIPNSLSPDIRTLLSGLLTTDASRRWQWEQVARWLKNEIPSLKTTEAASSEKISGPIISLGDLTFHRPDQFALHASETENWDFAKTLLERGTLTTWLAEQEYNQQTISSINSIRSDSTLTDDFKLSLSLMLLNEQLPLAIRGEIVNQRWLLQNEGEASQLIEGNATTRLRQMNRAKDICQRADRAVTVRKRLELLEIHTDESLLKTYLLAPLNRLQALWAAKYLRTPDSSDPSIESLMQKKMHSEEDLIILLSADVCSFRTTDEVIERTMATLSEVGLDEVEVGDIRKILDMPRSAIYSTLDDRLDGFTRCGVETLDSWADTYRMDRRLKFERVLALLAVPESQWAKPPKQEYIRNILTFFERKILAKVNRGPLARQSIAKNSSAIDVTELAPSPAESERIINGLLERSPKAIELSAQHLIENEIVATRVSNLIKKTRIFVRDTGRHGLFLGFPYVMYLGGSVDEKRTWRAAPVILWPVRFESDSSGREKIKLGAEILKEEVRLNPALEGLLNLSTAQFQRWNDCVDEILRHQTINFRQVLEVFSQVVACPTRILERLPTKDLKPRAEDRFLVGSAVVFNCDFSGKSIADDLRQMRDYPVAGTALERALRIETQPTVPFSVERESFDRYAVMDLDPSQSEAILRARNPLGLHIEGPPGTGKSQTIVNIIADSIARGQSVLVVCQKQAALNIVAKRLKSRGLNDRLFFIQDAQKDRTRVLKDTREQVTAGLKSGTTLPFLRSAHHKQVKLIDSIEAELNGHRQLYEQVQNESGLSYRNILADLIRIDKSKALIVQPLRKIFASLHYEEVSEIESSCASVALLWLNSGFESSELHVLKYAAWDEVYELELTAAFLEYEEAERTRSTALSNYSKSPDSSEIDLLENWLSENTATLSNQSEDILEFFKILVALTPNGFVEGSEAAQIVGTFERLQSELALLEESPWHIEFYSTLAKLNQDTVSSLLQAVEIALTSESDDQSATVSARWQIMRFLEQSRFELGTKFDRPIEMIEAFDEFVQLEKSRSSVLHEHAECFDTSDEFGLGQWLSANANKYLDMPNQTREDLVVWFPLFERENSDGEKIISALDGMTKDLGNLDIKAECLRLLPLYNSFDDLSLQNWSNIARDAVAADSPFREAVDKQIVSKWQIIKLLRQNQVSSICEPPSPINPDLKEALSQFVAAEEKRIACLRDNKNCQLLQESETLESWLSENKSFFLALADADRKWIAEYFHLFEKAPNSPGSKIIHDLTQCHQSLLGLNDDWHHDLFSESVTNLNPGLLKERIKQAETAANNNGILRFLSPNNYVARAKIRNYLLLIGADANAASVKEFLNSATLEREMGPIRSRFVGILKQLKASTSDFSVGNISELKFSVESLLDSLKRVQTSVSLSATCPSRNDLKAALLTSDKVAFAKFVEDSEASIDFYKARKLCLVRLKALEPWFDSTWVEKYQRLANSLDNDLPGLSEIWNSLEYFSQPTFEIFAKSIELELEVRPIRAQIEKIRKQLGLERSALLSTSIADLAKFVESVRKRTGVVADFVAQVNTCPVNESAKAPLVSNSFAEVQRFLSLCHGAIARAKARRECLASIGSLSLWFEKSWTSALSYNIESNQSNLEAVNAIRPTLEYGHTCVLQRFFEALSLEVVLAPIRREIGEIRRRLFQKELVQDLSSLSTCSNSASQYACSFRNGGAVLQIVDSCPWAGEIRKLVQNGSLKDFEQILSYLSGIVLRETSRRSSIECLRKLDEWFDASWVAKQEQIIVGNRSNRTDFANIKVAFQRLRPFQQFRTRAKSLDPNSLKVLSILRGYEKSLASLTPVELPDVVRETIRQESRLAWRSDVEQKNPSLLMDSEDIFRKVQSLAEETKKLFDINERMLALPDYHKGIADDAQTWKSATLMTGARQVRLREFLEHGSQMGLLKVRPIWLMDPEIACRVLPLKSGFFDKVIFDEASQLLVEYSIPVLYRAKTAVVSGDAKQMPPSDHFSSRRPADEDGPEEDSEDEFLTDTQRNQKEEAWNRKEIKDCPDLLTLASEVFPDTRLEIHYRSKYRELISYSNAAFYDGKLNVPANHPDEEIARVKPIEVVRANGIYKKQSNVSEAKSVIEQLKLVWQKNPIPTVGVVTFNFHQASLIEDLLAEEVSRNPKFAAIKQLQEAREEDGEDMSFFVKNLENVQGDERDIIIFSTTFGPDENNKFSRAFGKLIQAGGERRLNVGITRAKEKVILVTSLPIASISDCVQSSRKPFTPREHFHCYMEYASRLNDGSTDQARVLTEKLSESSKESRSPYIQHNGDGFVEDVKEYVESLGYKLVMNKGDAGAFDVDLSVVNPNTGLFCVGIECDSPNHPLLERAYHRETWRQFVLKKSYGVIHRINSRDWLFDQQTSKERLRSEIAKQIS